MQSALDRRQRILEVISDRRFETMDNLALEFGVSKRTIQNDITVLGCSAPIRTVRGRGGGVRAEQGWYLGRRYLRREQEELLRELLPSLVPEKRAVMEEILTAFAKPADYGTWP